MATVLDLVKHYQHTIEKYPGDEQKVLKSIDKLFNLDVTVQHLQETGVGRTVNALRKEAGEVGHAARALVSKWKLMVAAEESDQEGDHSTDTTTYNGHGNGRDSDDNSRQSRIKYEQYDKSSNVKAEYGSLNGNYSGGKRKHYSSEEVEPDIKKSKSTSISNHHEEYKKNPEVQVKREQDSEDESDYTDQSETSDSESDESESSRENRDRKIKQEPTENHKSSKHSSSHKSSRDHTRESSSSKHSHESEKQPKGHHSSESSHRHSSEKSSSKGKSHSSHKEKSSKEKDNIDKQSKPERSSTDKDKKEKEEQKSSSKHKQSSDKHKSSNSDSSSDKLKSQNKKHSSKSEKHRSSSQSHKSDQDKHKSSSEKEIPDDRHKSKHSSSSKDKHSSTSKERSKDRSSSSKEKSDASKESHHSHKSGKKPASSSDSKSKHSDSKPKSEKHDEGNNETKSKHKSSSSSSHKSKSSSSKTKEDVPKKTSQTNGNADSDDGIGCESGASFAEALGMVSPSKPKKKTTSSKESFPTNTAKDLSPASLLAPTAKLAPLPQMSQIMEISALPDISPNYKPRPPPKLMPHFTEDEALTITITSKNQRTKVYSGNKVIGKIPTLYEMCVQILQEHIDALEYTGGVPYDILKPIVDRATPQQLFVLEHYNPYLMEDTDHLWEKFCQRNFRNKQRQEMETWREMYIRCQEEQEHRLKSLTANIRLTQEAKKAPIKQTKMAYVDSVVKPPRNIARKQAQHGTAHASSASPAARVASLAAAPNVLRGNTRPTPTAHHASASLKPKKAPLMQKALQFMRGRKR